MLRVDFCLLLKYCSAALGSLEVEDEIRGTVSAAEMIPTCWIFLVTYVAKRKAKTWESYFASEARALYGFLAQMLLLISDFFFNATFQD